MKKITLFSLAALMLCVCHMTRQISAAPRKKADCCATKAVKKVTKRSAPTTYSSRTFNLAQTNLVQDLGPVSKQKTIDINLPEAGDKNAALVQFKPTSDATLADGQVEQVLVRTQKLSQKKAQTNGIDWVDGKSQVVVEVFAGQNSPTAEKSKLTRHYQQAFLKSELADKGPIKLKVKNNGAVGVKMKDTTGKYAELATINVAQVEQPQAEKVN